ncbi:hypothetical protein [Halobellus sp. EA9]|uniref:hypothetical protein n=1 Tax=Halobellus sp. EA9 TaxID=3421647 RepID=UPI003EBF4897
MSTTSRRDLADEVTRVSAVSYLQGATGHGVGSLAFLLVGVVGLVVVLAAVFFVFRRLGVTYGSYLLGGVLALGNLAALALA